MYNKNLVRSQLILSIFLSVIGLFCLAINVSQAEDYSKNKTRLFQPTSLPTVLTTNSGKAHVNFKVYFKLSKGNKKPRSIQITLEKNKPFDLNDAGKHGDFFANDNIYGGFIKIDTKAYKAGQCLNYSAFTGQLKSSVNHLCFSALPTRTAASNFKAKNILKLKDGGKALADELLVKFKADITDDKKQSLMASINATITGSIPVYNLYQIHLEKSLTETELNKVIKQLNNNNQIENVSPNILAENSATAPTDPEYTNQHGLQLIMQDPNSGKNVWEIPNATGSGTSIFVLDSGVRFNHQDLTNINLNCADLGDISSGAFNIAPCAAGDEDSDIANIGHGTRIIGAIAAEKSNGNGISGIAPEAQIISVKSINAGLQTENSTALNTIASTIETLAGVSYLPASEPVIINFSRNLGGNQGLPAVQTLCAAVNNVVNGGGTPGLDREAIIVNSAGNNNLDFTDWNAWPVQCKNSSVDPSNASSYFSNANNNFLITVGNSVTCASAAASCVDGTSDTRFATSIGSNYGALLDVFAPGTSVLTPDDSSNTGYSSASGTSLSAPFVSGAAAILLSCGVPVDEINNVLKASAPVNIPFPGGSAPRINVFTALQSVNTSPTTITFPSANIPDGTNTTIGGGLILGTLSHNDPDTCDDLIFSKSGGADADNFSINASNELIFDDGVVNNATQSSYTVEVTVTDYFDQTASLTIIINILPSAIPNPPTNISITMDRSGSMLAPSADASVNKIQALQNAAGLMADYIAIDGNHRLGLSQFNNAIVPFVAPNVFTFQTLNSTNVNDAKSAIDSITGGGGTNIISGIEGAAALLNSAPASERRVVVLFTDGEHNIPSTLSAADLENQLNTELDNVSSNLELYSIGYGTDISELALSNLANNNGGWHLNEQNLEPMGLGKTFADTAAAIINDQATYDPFYELSPGEKQSLDVPINNTDKNISIVIQWQSPNRSQLDIQIIPPLKDISKDCIIDHSSSMSGVKQAFAKKYRIVRVELPFRCGQHLIQAGNWQVNIKNQGRTHDAATHALNTTSLAAVNSPNTKTETVSIAAYTSSNMVLNTQVSHKDLKKESIIKFSAEFEADKNNKIHLPIRDINFTAYVLPPLANTGDSTEQDKLGAENKAPKIIAREPIIVEMKSDKDRLGLAHGVFNQFKQYGLYQIRIVAQGTNHYGVKVRKESRTSIFVTDPADRCTWFCNFNMLILILILLLICIFYFYKKSANKS